MAFIQLWFHISLFRTLKKLSQLLSLLIFAPLLPLHSLLTALKTLLDLNKVALTRQFSLTVDSLPKASHIVVNTLPPLWVVLLLVVIPEPDSSVLPTFSPRTKDSQYQFVQSLPSTQLKVSLTATGMVRDTTTVQASSASAKITLHSGKVKSEKTGINGSTPSNSTTWQIGPPLELTK